MDFSTLEPEVIKKKQKFHQILYVQVIFAIILGILLGHFYPEFGESLKPLGDAFIKIVKMIIAPVIFLTVVTGIASMTNMSRVGRVTGKAMLYFFTFSSLALVIGMIVANIIQPGKGLNIDPTTLANDKVAGYIEKAHDATLVDFFMNIIPKTLISPLAEGSILQVLFVAVLFGISLAAIGDRGRPIVDILNNLTAPVFYLVGMLMKLAPIGAFGAMAFTIGKYGIGSLAQLAQLIICFYVTCLLFIFIVLGTISRVCGFSILKMIRMIREELLIVLGTSSSESVLPRMLKKLEIAGCEKSVVGLVIPTGYSFNLDGTSIYLTMAAIFIAQATNTPLDIEHQITLLVVLLISSKGAAGVTGSGFIVMAATLSAVGHIPVAGLALILGIDRFMSEARALTNLVGNSLATIVVAKWVGQLDKTQLDYALANPEEVDRLMSEENKQTHA